MNIPGNVNVWVLIAIVLYGFVLYFSPLQSKSFYFDDKFSIEHNQVIKQIDVPKIFNAFNTRFLVGLSFAVNYQLCALNPAGYRLINLLIHCFNAFLVYLLVKSFYRSFIATRHPGAEWPSFFASLLFLCHPIQTEPVNFITQRFVLMGTFFYLLTLFLYIQYRCRSQKRYLIAGYGAALAAMFCKEFVVTLPFMIALYDFYFLGALAEPWWQRCKRIVPFFVIVLIVPLLLLRTPPEAIGVANIADSGKHIDITRAKKSIDRQQYFLTELNVVSTYVRLLFVPVNQNFDYDYPLSNGLDCKTALCGVFLLCLLALAAVTYKPHRLISFSILWFFIALSVESSFIPIGHVIAEYRVYLASVGFVFLVTFLVYTRSMDWRKLNIIAAVIIIGFSVLTYQRNKIWKDELSLWNDTVEKSPYKARPYNGRGTCWADQGNFTRALADFSQAVKLNPKYAEAYYNLGKIYYNQGNLTQSIIEYSEAIKFKPDARPAYINRATVYYQLRQYDKAWADVHKAEELRGVVNPKFINILKKASGRNE